MVDIHLLRQRAETAAPWPGDVSGEDFARLRQANGLGAEKAGMLVEASGASIRRYEKGKTASPSSLSTTCFRKVVTVLQEQGLNGLAQ